MHIIYACYTSAPISNVAKKKTVNIQNIQKSYDYLLFGILFGIDPVLDFNYDDKVGRYIYSLSYHV